MNKSEAQRIADKADNMRIAVAATECNYPQAEILKLIAELAAAVAYGDYVQGVGGGGGGGGPYVRGSAGNSVPGGPRGGGAGAATRRPQ